MRPSIADWRSKLSSANPARFRRLSIEGIWIVIGPASSMLGTLILIHILTKKLEPLAFGELALALTISGLVNQVVMGATNNGIGRFHAIALERNVYADYLAAVRRLLYMSVAAMLSISCALLLSLVLIGELRLLSLSLTILALSIVSALNSAFSSYFNAVRARATVAIHSAMDAWLRIAIALAITSQFGASSVSVAASYLVSGLLVFCSQAYQLRSSKIRPIKESNSSDCSSMLREIWSFSWPFSAFGIFTWAQQASDRWALQTYATAEQVGNYAVVFQLGYSPVVILASLATTLIGPIIYQKSGAGTDSNKTSWVHKFAWRATFICLVVTLFATMVAAILHGEIFSIVVAKSFRSTSYLLPWVVLAGGMFAGAQILGVKLTSELRSGAQIAPKIGSAIIGVSSNFLCAKYFGIDGVAAALVIFSTIYLCWMGIIAANQTPSGGGNAETIPITRVL